MFYDDIIDFEVWIHQKHKILITWQQNILSWNEKNHPLHIKNDVIDKKRFPVDVTFIVSNKT